VGSPSALRALVLALVVELREPVLRAVRRAGAMSLEARGAGWSLVVSFDDPGNRRMTESLTKTSVLVVEDEAVIALHLRGLLEASGFEVVGVASDAKRALELTQKLRPNVVLMDVRIEGEVDGLSAAEELYVCENIPVVFLSAYSDEESLARAVSTGAYGYLLKPLAGTLVSSTLRIAVRKHEEIVSLRCSSQWQRAALEHLGGALLVTDPDGALSFMNGAAVALTGWSLLDARLEGPAWFEQLFGVSSALEGTFRADFARLHRRDGSTIDVAVRRTVLDPDDDGVRRTIWLVRPYPRTFSSARGQA
jgi:AmiR/NasT family two-component response regulator